MEKQTRTATQRKIDSQLLYAGRMARGMEAAPGVPTLETDIEIDSKGFIEVEIRASVNGKVTDVPSSSVFCPYIKRLQALSITQGCTATTFCPSATVTRQAMAVFLVRAIEGEPSPTLCAGGSPFAAAGIAVLSAHQAAGGARRDAGMRRRQLLPRGDRATRFDGGIPGTGIPGKVAPLPAQLPARANGDH